MLSRISSAPSMNAVDSDPSADPEPRYDWALDSCDEDRGGPSSKEATSTGMTVTSGRVVRRHVIYVNDDGVVTPILSATRNDAIE